VIVTLVGMVQQVSKKAPWLHFCRGLIGVGSLPHDIQKTCMLPHRIKGNHNHHRFTRDYNAALRALMETYARGPACSSLGESIYISIQSLQSKVNDMTNSCCRINNAAMRLINAVTGVDTAS
jgi:hypothetical protein